MASFYSVLRYVPDPTAEEFINFAVVVVDEHGASVRFLRDMRRMRCLAPKEDLGFVLELRNWIKETVSRQLHTDPGLGPSMSTALLTEMAHSWGGVLQATSPRASLLARAELLENIAAKMLKERAPSKPAKKWDRLKVAGEAHEAVRTAFERVFAVGGRDMVHRDFPVKGKVVTHDTDVTTVVNKDPTAVVLALSFDKEEDRDFLRVIDATAFAMSDLKSYRKELRCAVVHSPPPKKSKAFERARAEFRALDVDMVGVDHVLPWARDLAERTRAKVSTLLEP